MLELAADCGSIHYCPKNKLFSLGAVLKHYSLAGEWKTASWFKEGLLLDMLSAVKEKYVKKKGGKLNEYHGTTFISVRSTRLTAKICAICERRLSPVERESFPQSSEVRPKEHGW